jgi:hypothetical protein
VLNRRSLTTAELTISLGRGVFIGPDGKPTRSDYVEWPSVPEDLGALAVDEYEC